MAEYLSLKKLLETWHSKDHPEGDSDAKFTKLSKMTDLMRKKAFKSRSFVITSCKHKTHYRCANSIERGGHLIYGDMEKPCPMCRNAMNFMIPSSKFFEKFKKEHKSENLVKVDLFKLSLNVLSHSKNEEKETPFVVAIREECDSKFEEYFNFYDLLVINFSQFSDLYSRTTKKVIKEQDGSILAIEALAYMVNLTELEGLQNFIEKHAQIYSDIYKLVRMKAIYETKDSEDAKEYFDEVSEMREDIEYMLDLVFSNPRGFKHLDVDQILIKMSTLLFFCIQDEQSVFDAFRDLV